MSDTTQKPSPEQKPRRRFFKRAAIATLIGSIAAGVGLKAFAHGGFGGFGCWHRGGFMAGPIDPAKVEEHLDRMLKHLYVEVDATEEQKQRLAPIVKQAAKDLLPRACRGSGKTQGEAGAVSACSVERVSV
jgi:periplasmic protein CpxP/Spy